MNILLVDDEPEIVDNLSMLLRHVGYHCSAFYGVMSASMAAERDHYDVVITDYNMPSGDGLQLAANLKQTQPGIRIIMITGSEPSLISRPPLHGMIDHLLPKPVDLHHLLDLLEKIKSEVKQPRIHTLAPQQPAAENLPALHHEVKS